MCCNSILKQQDLASLTACMGRLQLIKPYGKQSVWTQHNISRLSDRTPIPHQMAVIYSPARVLPPADTAARPCSAMRAALFAFPARKAQSNGPTSDWFGRGYSWKAPVPLTDPFDAVSSRPDTWHSARSESNPCYSLLLITFNFTWNKTAQSSPTCRSWYERTRGSPAGLMAPSPRPGALRQGLSLHRAASRITAWSLASRGSRANTDYCALCWCWLSQSSPADKRNPAHLWLQFNPCIWTTGYWAWLLEETMAFGAEKVRKPQQLRWSRRTITKKQIANCPPSVLRRKLRGEVRAGNSPVWKKQGDGGVKSPRREAPHQQRKLSCKHAHSSCSHPTPPHPSHAEGTQKFTRSLPANYFAVV